jgi:Rieske Fe-S protein
MKYRKLLIYSVVIVSFVGVAAVAYVFVKAMAPSERAITAARFYIEEVDVSALVPGNVYEVMVANEPIFILRPTKEILSDLLFMDSHVWHPEMKSYDKENNFFIYIGLSTRFGCMLTPYKKGEVQSWMVDKRTWYGGYFDRCHDSSYDYAGRTIMDYEYTYNGFNLEVPNLKVPDYEIQNGKTIVIGKLGGRKLPGNRVKTAVNAR